MATEAERTADAEPAERAARAADAERAAPADQRRAAAGRRGAARPALGDLDRMRLRGCLDDATAERTTAKVLGDGQVGG
ncbi:hypothetical protein [Streptomyces sp. CMB-StM0423]|uniref:hypothetical protein n=1 Tax=Streptomyces sp. CMB-StM0423 TaxID=2059884 RepID=UPI00131CDC61|nr:hypothetical protein [Streptomyces sp. CMB-StM0423]